ncbi:MAG: long-chain-fatty-acid--CoA ligase [Steroidobacterales bacterium]
MQTALSPLDFARRARKLYARREAVVDGDLRLTYAEFLDRCDRASGMLARLGVVNGDRVATIAPNTHQHLEQFYAIPALGAVIVPMNYRLTAEDFVYMVAHSGAVVLCVHADYLDLIDAVRDRMPGIRHFVALEGRKAGWLDYESLLADSEPLRGPPPADEQALLAINYTSGTTSRPKGVMITHRNAWINSVGTQVHWPLVPGDRYLWTLPMFHANGWTFTWSVTAAGATHVCLRKVEPAGIYERVNGEQITHLCAAPTVLIGVANGPQELRRGLRRGVRVMTAGAPPAATTIERLEGELGWDITQAYGLTETSPFITICEMLPEHASLTLAERATIKARQGVELVASGDLRVVDQDLNDVVPDGNSLGEIVVRGNAVMLGYYQDPEATAKAFAGGWFHSGDAAVVHPDAYVEIRDRYKDVIISGGENISSIEVEAALLRHPAVLEAAVVGVANQIWGETPEAFVVLRAGCQADEAGLREFLRGRLAHFKVPSGYHFVAELPKTATGKIQKFVLRKGRAAIASQ